MDKFGYICRQIARDIKAYEVESAYAYNSPFDEKVFNFCCDWFKCINPFENIPVYDIRGYAHNFICNTDEYIQYCEENKLFTESGNYSTTAESLFRFILKDNTFEEEHTALSDSEIETEILIECLNRGAEVATAYPVKFSFERKVEKKLDIVKNKETIASFLYQKITINKERTKITLKQRATPSFSNSRRLDEERLTPKISKSCLTKLKPYDTILLNVKERLKKWNRKLNTI